MLRGPSWTGGFGNGQKRGDPDRGLGEGSGGESSGQEAPGRPGLAERRPRRQAKLGSDPRSAITLAE